MKFCCEYSYIFRIPQPKNKTILLNKYFPKNAYSAPTINSTANYHLNF